MKSLASIIAILLLASSTLFALSNDKMVKTERINGKFVPVVTLKTIEVSATKKAVKSNSTIIASETFATTKVVNAVYKNGKVYPLVNLKTVEVKASANTGATGNNTPAASATVVSAIVYNGEVMPMVELNTVEIIASKVEQTLVKNASQIVTKMITGILSK